MTAQQLSIPWLRALRRYVGFILLANVVWEVAHLPLYSLWHSSSPLQLASAAAHCTLGDVIIAIIALVLTLLAVGEPDWPRTGSLRIAGLSTLSGVLYTTFSEWLNIVIRTNWQYAPEMPVVPGLGVGLSPFLQWILVPPIAHWFAQQNVYCRRDSQ